MRTLITFAAGLALFGCASQSSEEAKAASELAPKPLTAEQKKQIESITKGASAPPAHPGR